METLLLQVVSSVYRPPPGDKINTLDKGQNHLGKVEMKFQSGIRFGDYVKHQKSYS